MSSHKCNLPVTINSNIRHFDHLSGFSVSPFRPPSHNLPSEGRWEVRNDRNAEEERECCCLLSHTERLCLGMSRWWIWLALGWHMHIRRKAKTVIHSPRPQLPLPRFLWMAPSHSFPTYIYTHTTHSDALISTTCPHLSACRKDSNMCAAWGWVEEMRVRCTIRSKVCCSPIACLTFCKSAAPG